MEQGCWWPSSIPHGEGSPSTGEDKQRETRKCDRQIAESSGALGSNFNPRYPWSRHDFCKTCFKFVNYSQLTSVHLS